MDDAVEPAVGDENAALRPADRGPGAELLALNGADLEADAVEEPVADEELEPELVEVANELGDDGDAKLQMKTPSLIPTTKTLSWRKHWLTMASWMRWATARTTQSCSRARALGSRATAWTSRRQSPSLTMNGWT